MNHEKLKHLEFIQSIIMRMNSNSFQIKGLAITVVTALLAIYTIDLSNILIPLVGIISTIIFWFLDAYYLLQERRFRGLYDDVAEISDKSINIKSFEMRPDLYTGGRYSYHNVFFSNTIWPLYFSVIVILFALANTSF